MSQHQISWYFFIFSVPGLSEPITQTCPPNFSLVLEKPQLEKEEDEAIEDKLLVKENIFEFGIALSCKSFLLQKISPYVFDITSSIPNYILNEKCKGPCKGRTQRKGPRYKKSIILARGAHLTLICPE